MCIRDRALTLCLLLAKSGHKKLFPPLFDYLVGLKENRRWQRDAEGLKLVEHKHIGTTALYCDVSDDTLRKAVELV